MKRLFAAAILAAASFAQAQFVVTAPTQAACVAAASAAGGTCLVPYVAPVVTPPVAPPVVTPPVVTAAAPVATIQPSLIGVVNGAVTQGKDLTIQPGAWAQSGTVVVPTARKWNFYYDQTGGANLKFFASNTLPAANFDANNFPASTSIKVTEVATINGVAIESPLASAILYKSAAPTVVTPPVVVTPPAGGAGAITPMAYQTAGKLNAAQPANQIQVMGNYPLLNTIPESGITGNGTVNGTNVRFGKIADPTGTLDPATGKVRQVYLHAVAAGDPETACCYRTDVSLANGSLAKDTTYWSVFELYIPAATANSGDNQAIVGIHQGSDTGSGNWEMEVNTGTFVVVVTNDSSQTGVNLKPQPSVNAWHKYAVHYNLSLNASVGFVDVYVDGTLSADFKGVTTVAGGGDYAKFGMYAYQMTGGNRYDLWRSYYLVKDNGYSLAQVTAMLQ